MRKFKRVLITGISGSGGSYLAEHIQTKDKKIKIFGIARAKNKYNLKNLSKVKIYNGDLRNFNRLKSILKQIKPDVIFHLASVTDVRLSFDRPKEVIENNKRTSKFCQ